MLYLLLICIGIKKIYAWWQFSQSCNTHSLLFWFHMEPNFECFAPAPHSISKSNQNQNGLCTNRINIDWSDCCGYSLFYQSFWYFPTLFASTRTNKALPKFQFKFSTVPQRTFQWRHAICKCKIVDCLKLEHAIRATLSKYSIKKEPRR